MHFCSKSFERRRAQFNQAMVRSTIQRLGWMINSPVILVENSTLRLWILVTTSTKNLCNPSQPTVLAPDAVALERYPWARTAFGIVDVGGMNENLVEVFLCVHNDLTLTSFDFFSPIEAWLFALSCRFYALGIHDKKAWMFISTIFQTLNFHQISEYFLPNSKLWKVSEVSNRPSSNGENPSATCAIDTPFWPYKGCHLHGYDGCVWLGFHNVLWKNDP